MNLMSTNNVTQTSTQRWRDSCV